MEEISPPAKKARTAAPRGGPACSRCHGRKARCDRPEPGKACRNCEIAGVECITCPKAPRKRKAPVSAPLSGSSTTNQGLSTQQSHSQWNAQAETHSFDVLVNPSAHASTSVLPPRQTAHYSNSQDPPDITGDQTESVSGSVEPSLLSDGGVAQLDDKRLGSVARSVAFLSLNASADASFLGASAGFSWTELVVSGLLADSKLDNASWTFDSDGPPTKLPSPYLEDVSAEVASSVFDICYKHIQPRYPFTDWLRMHRWFNERISIMRAASQPGASPGTRAAALFLWLFFALGTSLSRRSPLPGLVSSASYFEQAVEHLDAVAAMHNLVGLQALLLLSMYALQRPAGISSWFLSGSAMRLAIAMGLHRKLPPERERAIGFYAAEMRKRCFWSAYIVDRMVAMTLGRPLGISDSAIDADLPMDVNCVQFDWPTEVPRAATSMTSALHHIRLKRIDSQVHESVYRVDTPEPDMIAAANLLSAVDMWTLGIPQEASTDQAKALPCCTRDWFLLKAEQTKQHLLRPLTTYERDRSYWLTLCAQSAAATSEAQRRLHQGRPFSPTITALHSVFLSGITLLHCVRTFPGALTPADTHKAIRATSNILYSYAQEYSQVAQTFYDTFEALAELCLTPSAAPTNQDPWTANLADLASNMPAGTEFGAFLQSLGLDPALNSFLDDSHQVPPVSAANYDTLPIQVPFQTM